MANNLKLTLEIAYKDSGREVLQKAAAALEAVGRSAGESSEDAARLARELAALGGAGSGLGKTRDGVESISGQLARARQELGGFLGLQQFGHLVSGLAQTADAWAGLSARLKLATDSEQAFAAASEQVFGIAQRTRADLEATAHLYGKLAQAIRDHREIQADAAQVTETIAQAVAITGASSAAASAALTQFVQGLQSGALRGDEFNSVMEQAPRLAQALADSLGVGTGALRQQAEQGKLTAATLIQALQDQAPRIAAEFERIPKTISGSFQQLSNEWLRFVGQLDAGAGASARVAAGISAIAGHLDDLAAAAAIAGETLLATLAVKGAGALTAWAGQLAANRAATVASAEAAVSAQAAALGEARARETTAAAAQTEAAAKIANTQALLAGIAAAREFTTAAVAEEKARIATLRAAEAEAAGKLAAARATAAAAAAALAGGSGAVSGTGGELGRKLVLERELAAAQAAEAAAEQRLAVVAGERTGAENALNGTLATRNRLQAQLLGQTGLLAAAETEAAAAATAASTAQSRHTAALLAARKTAETAGSAVTLLGSSLRAIPQIVVLTGTIAALDTAYEGAKKLYERLAALEQVQHHAAIQAVARANQADAEAAIAATERYSGLVTQTAAAVAQLGDAERGRYAEALAGASAYQEGLLQQAAAQERLGQDTSTAQAKAKAALEALKAAGDQFAEGIARSETAVRELLSVDAQQLIQQFGDLQAKGEDTGKALAGLGEQLDPGDPKAIQAWGQALVELKNTGQISARAMQEAFEGFAGSLDGADFAAFGTAMGAAFGASARDLEAFAALADTVAREALTRLGVDAGQALSGIGAGVREGIGHLRTLEQALAGMGATADQSGRALAASLSAVAGSAQTRQEIEAIRTEVEALGETGKLSAAIRTEAEAELAAQLRQVEQAEADRNAVLQEAVRLQAEAVGAADRETAAVERQAGAKTELARLAYAAAKALGDEKAAAEWLVALHQTEIDGAEQVAAAKAQAATAAREKAAAVLAEAEADGTVTEAETKLVQAAEEVVAVKQAEAQAAKDAATSKVIEATATEKQAEAAKASADAATEQASAQQDANQATEASIPLALASERAVQRVNQVVRAGSEAWVTYAESMRLALESQRQLQAVEDLTQQIRAATESGRGLVQVLGAAGVATSDLGEIADQTRSQFDLLDQEQLSGLNSALQSAAQRVEQLRESARSLLSSLQSEINRLSGNESANWAAELAQRQAEIRRQLAEAQRAGDSASAADLQKALGLAGEVYQAKIREAADEYRKTTGQAAEAASRDIAEAGRELSEATGAAVSAAAAATRQAALALAGTLRELRSAAREYSLGIDEKIRELQRAGMDSAAARVDTILEMQEKVRAAGEALRDGDIEHAKALRDQVAEIAEALATATGGISAAGATAQAISGLQQAKAINQEILRVQESVAEAAHQAELDRIEAAKAAAISAGQSAHAAKLAAIVAARDAELAAAKAVHEAVMAYIREEGRARTVTVQQGSSRTSATVRAATGGLITDPGQPPQLDFGGGLEAGRSHGQTTPQEVWQALLGFAVGGRVPGGGDGDTVPALLTPGEYVVRRPAVEHYGVPLLHALNRLHLPVQKFAQGGPVLPVLPRGQIGPSGPSAPEVTIALSLGGQTASGRFPRTEVTEALLSELRRAKAVR
jgi:tape measure domain-containing protein